MRSSRYHWSAGAVARVRALEPRRRRLSSALVRGAFPLVLAAVGCGPRCDRPWYADRDGDGFGDRGDVQVACDQPEAYVADANDCDDRDASVHPGAHEQCNDVDDDCDGVVDRDDQIWYRDLDRDGVGDKDVTLRSCGAPDGYVLTPGDCDDRDPTVWPGAGVELCDGKDQDCDGLIDEGAPGTVTYYPDEDFDGWGNQWEGRTYCEPPPGWIARGGDCDDGSYAVNPGRDEVCNGGIDDDCDGLPDEYDPQGVQGLVQLWPDADLDGYGDREAASFFACQVVSGTSMIPTDCDDGDPTVHPNGVEVCGGGDEDCDGLIDDEDGSLDLGTAIAGWPDEDGDGYGRPGPPVLACAYGAGVVGNDEDCDDGDRFVGPDWWIADLDGDGAGVGTAAMGQGCAPPSPGWVNVLAPFDCDDAEPTIRAGVPDPCGDGVDQDCTGVDPACGVALDAILDLDELGRGWVNGAVATDAYDVVALGPDLDGDGFADALLGSSSVAAPTDVLVLPGPGPEVAGPWAPSIRIRAPGPGFGAALLVLPDATGDGRPDLLVGGPGVGAGGEAQLLAGPSFSGPAARLVGFVGSELGAALASAGDLDGVGGPGIVVGAPGAAEVMLITVPLGGVVAPTSAALRLQGVGDELGRAVAFGSDLDGDGLPELLAGAPADSYAGLAAGAVYAVGAQLGVHSPASVADGMWWGAAGGELGAALVAGADFDGDGRPDVLAGAPNDDAAAPDSGAAYVLTAMAIGDADVTAAYVVRGADAEMGLGAGLALTDLDGDGAADLVLGAPGAAFGGAASGAVFVFYGPRSGAVDSDDADGMVFGAPGTLTGVGVAVGEIDADPSPDLWIAQPGLPGGGARLVPGP